MNDLQVFSNSQFGELGIMSIEGREYFPATACARMLGYTNPQKAIRDHCKGVNKTLTPSSGGNQEVNYIPEGDLYRLITRSKLPAAEQFERWVFDEVLPTIRRQGAYTPDIGELISKTVKATVNEIMRELIPVLTQNAAPDAPIQIARPSKRRSRSLVSRQDTDIRQEIEDMILSNRYTCMEISAYLAKQYQIYISKSAIDRHAKLVFAMEKATDGRS